MLKIALLSLEQLLGIPPYSIHRCSPLESFKTRYLLSKMNFIFFTQGSKAKILRRIKKYKTMKGKIERLIEIYRENNVHYQELIPYYEWRVRVIAMIAYEEEFLEKIDRELKEAEDDSEFHKSMEKLFRSLQRR